MPWADFDDRELNVLRALFDTLIPADDFPGGWDGGVSAYLENSFQFDLKPFIPQYKDLIATLGDEFLSSSLEARDDFLKSLDPQLINFAVGHAAEGYYAAPGPGWQMIGFEVTA